MDVLLHRAMGIGAGTARSGVPAGCFAASTTGDVCGPLCECVRRAQSASRARPERNKRRSRGGKTRAAGDAAVARSGRGREAVERPGAGDATDEGWGPCGRRRPASKQPAPAANQTHLHVTSSALPPFTNHHPALSLRINRLRPAVPGCRQLNARHRRCGAAPRTGQIKRPRPVAPFHARPSATGPQSMQPFPTFIPPFVSPSMTRIVSSGCSGTTHSCRVFSNSQRGEHIVSHPGHLSRPAGEHICTIQFFDWLLCAKKELTTQKLPWEKQRSIRGRSCSPPHPSHLPRYLPCNPPSAPSVCFPTVTPNSRLGATARSNTHVPKNRARFIYSS